MAEEKIIHPNVGKIFMVFGVLAIDYGIVKYLIEALNWADYTAWIVGGVILLLVSWAKQTKS